MKILTQTLQHKRNICTCTTYDTLGTLNFQMKKSLHLKQRETIYPKVNLKDLKGTSSR
jgi:hypothetical protein